MKTHWTERYYDRIKKAKPTPTERFENQYVKKFFKAWFAIYGLNPEKAKMCLETMLKHTNETNIIEKKDE